MRLVDADALIDVMTGACNIFDAHGVDTTISRTLITIAGQAPTIEAEPVRHAHWITKTRHEHYPSGKEYEADYCSACGMRGSLVYDYCPHCGAFMEEVSE